MSRSLLKEGYQQDQAFPDTTALSGLSEQEAFTRLRQEGSNEIASTQRRSVLTVAWDILREPMFLLLIAGGVIYLALGDIREALVLLGSILVIMGISLYQQQKTERALEALRDLSSPRALVIRGGEHRRIAGREVVRGDILVLAEGDRVPADSVLLWSLILSVDESLLTGESVPVRKRAEDGNTQMQEMGRPGGDDLPCVFSGTLVTQGQAIARVHATGMHTELGKIGSALQMVKPEHTSLQRETGNLVRLFAIAGVVLCTLVVLLYGILRGGWLNGLLAGIALAMSLLPEEFPVVLTVFLALGAWRISQKQVLTRRMPAIERLGETTVLCVDKTGTLTENRMTVQQLYASGASCAVQQPLQEPFESLAEFSVLASQRDPFDPMEQALLNLSRHCHTDYEHLHSDWTLLREYPFSSQLFAISHVWKAPQAEAYVIAAKGAPEAIFDLAHTLESASHPGLLRQRLRRYIGPSLLIIDEVGYTRLSPEQAHHFFELVAARYEHGSIIVTSNTSFAGWGTLLGGDEVLATALLDRLLHHAEVISVNGRSYRMKERQADRSSLDAQLEVALSPTGAQATGVL